MQGLDEKEYLRIVEEVISCLDIDEDSKEIMKQCIEEYWKYDIDISKDVDAVEIVDKIIAKKHAFSQYIEDYLYVVNTAFDGIGVRKYVDRMYSELIVTHIITYITNMLVFIIEELRRKQYHQEFNQYLEYNNYYDN